MSDFLEKAKKSGRIKELEEAFKEYPVEEEYHKGKIKNENNILFKIGVVEEEKIEQYKKRYLEIQ